MADSRWRNTLRQDLILRLGPPSTLIRQENRSFSKRSLNRRLALRVKAETHDATNRCDTTGCCNKSPRVTCENNCRCHRILSLRFVARIQTGLNACDISQRPRPRHTMQQQCRRGDLSPRFVVSCVSAFSVDRKHFENEAFRKRRGFIIMIILYPSFRNRNPK